MEHRFSFRDLVITTLLLALIISVWLAMKQYDRQWRKIQQIAQQQSQQIAAESRLNSELGRVHDLVEQLTERINGLPKRTRTDTELRTDVTAKGHQPATSTQSSISSDPFSRLRKVKANSDYAPGDWVIDAFPANVARITPLVTGDAYGRAIQNRVLESLITRDPDTLDWRPLLARSWSVGKHGLVFTFKLRRGITFSDGYPLTAEDVAFTFELINNSKIDAPGARNFYDKIQSVSINNTYEVEFTFKTPYFQALGMAGGMSILPKHFYSQFNAEQINRQPGLLLGSGNYRLESSTEWSPGKPLVLVRNERYWGESAIFDRLLYREINLDVARLTAYRNREIDIFSALPEQYVKMVKDEQIMSQSQRFEYERPTSGYGFIAWNQQPNGQTTRFADRRVRQAMTILTDRDRINTELLKGYGIIPSGPFNRLSKQHDPSVKPFAYDEQRATALLKQAGFEDRDGDGLLESEDGHPFKFKHTYPAGGAGGGFWDRVSLFLKDSYARVGIVVEPDPLEWAVFRENLQARQFDAISLAWGGGLESDIRQMFHSSQIADGADNFTSYANPELDRLIDEARRTVNESKRMPLWNACHRILHEDQPYTFLYSKKSLIFLDRRYHNPHRTRLGLNDRTEWYVRAAEQRYQ